MRGRDDERQQVQGGRRGLGAAVLPHGPAGKAGGPAALYGRRGQHGAEVHTVAGLQVPGFPGA
eukprot:3944640-Lingulodinium_polyedra.AAC.1